MDEWCQCDKTSYYDLKTIIQKMHDDNYYCIQCDKRVSNNELIKILITENEGLKNSINSIKSDFQHVENIIMEEEVRRQEFLAKRAKEREREIKILEKQTERFEMMDL